MKQSYLLLLALLLCSGIYAQDDKEPSLKSDLPATQKKTRCPKLLVDLSTGINNNAGLLGVGLDCHVASDISINAGLGLITSWGFKLYAGGKMYFNSCHNKWALGVGVTHSTGLKEFATELETISGQSQLVKLNMLPQTNATASAYRHWPVGKNKNSLYLQLGWSLSLTNKKFEQISGTRITDNSASVIKLTSPGGLILGFGFSFGS